MKNERLKQIVEKCVSDERHIAHCLNESSLSCLIVEAIDEADIADVKREIDKSRTEIGELKDFFQKLQLDPSLIKNATNYIDRLDAALNMTQGNLAAASFDTGTLSNFWGKKITLPNLTLAAITLYTKTSSFLNGMRGAVSNVQNQLDTLIKGDARNQPLIDIAGKDGVPDAKVLAAGLAKAFSKAVKGGSWWDRIKSWGDEPTSSAVLEKLPTLDPEAMGKFFAEAFMKKSIEEIMAARLPDAVKPEAGPLNKIGDQANEESDQTDPSPENGDATGEQASSGTADDTPASSLKATGSDAQIPEEELVQIDQQADQLAAALGKIPIPKNKLTKLLKDPAYAGKDGIQGKGPKATRARRKFRLALNKAAGKEIFKEHLVSRKHESNDVLDRWKTLAGIK